MCGSYRLKLVMEETPVWDVNKVNQTLLIYSYLLYETYYYYLSSAIESHLIIYYAMNYLAMQTPIITTYRYFLKKHANISLQSFIHCASEARKHPYLVFQCHVILHHPPNKLHRIYECWTLVFFLWWFCLFLKEKKTLVHSTVLLL